MREVVVQSAQRSSRASHGRQRTETEARDRVGAVGSLKMQWLRPAAEVGSADRIPQARTVMRPGRGDWDGTMALDNGVPLWPVVVALLDGGPE